MSKSIDLSKPRHDQSTYWGRLKHFAEVTDPRNLFATNKTLNEAKAIVDDFKNGKPTSATTEQLWQAKKLVDSTFHPDTGEKILLPFRMASFVPTNALIVAGMLMPNPTTAGILFWQWVNQSVNVAFNYCNANKTTEMNMTETTYAYGTAVASSCTIALGLNHWVKRLNGISPTALSLLQKAVPFTAVAAAGTINVFLMRQKELTDGIAIQDENGVIVGKSTVAGWDAISQVAVSRVATSFPAVFLPGIVMSQLEKTKFLKANPDLLYRSILYGVICGSLMAALPCAVAIFPQMAEISVDRLEPEFKVSSARTENPFVHFTLIEAFKKYGG
ncbi:Tricarboxylate/iron carrier [Chytridium lagenaria]|nr:Tricarboxylate/iron carrier [Chytridium lagenaria]